MSWDMDTAAIRARQTNPYFGYLYWLCPRRECKEVERMAISENGVIYYNPSILEDWTLGEGATVLWHEISHFFLRHSKRFQDLCHTAQLDPNEVHTIANVAMDSKINDMINASLVASGKDKTGAKLPDGCITSKLIKVPEEETWEQTFFRLLKSAARITVSGHGSGSGADGIKRPWEQGEGEEAEGEQPAPSGRVIERAIRHVANEIKEQEARSRGSVPASLVRAAEEILKPAVDPFADLRCIARHVATSKPGHGDITFTRESRRNLDPSLILPARKWQVPKVLVIIDTSGSMSNRDLGLACGALKAGLSRLRSSLTVVTGDTQGYGKQLVSNEQQVKLCGGGGTDMAAIITEFDTGEYDAMVCVTDCYTPWPAEETKAKLIVASTQKGQEGPDWAKTIYIGEE